MDRAGAVEDEEGKEAEVEGEPEERERPTRKKEDISEVRLCGTT
jgi:hypothetical protein